MRFVLVLLWLPVLTACDRLAEKPPAKAMRSGSMEHLVVQAYLDDLQSGDAQVRRNAARELGNSGTKANGAVAALQAIAQSDQDEAVRREAQASLERIGQ